MTETSGQWDVTTEGGFLSYYDATFAVAYGAAARLVRGERSDAEDLVHDAYVGLFDMVRRRVVSEVGVGWIVTAVRRRYVDRVRSDERARRRNRLVASPGVVTEDESEQLRADDLLGGLSERERAALVLRYVDGLSVSEVAELLGATVHATESLLQRAKRKSRERSQ